MTRPVLRSARLTLRPLVAEDAGFLVASLADRAVWEWLSVIPQPYTHADAMDFITRIAPSEAWLIEESGQPRGVIGLGNELGYWLARDAWGRGLITEAGDAVIDWAFSDPSRAELLSSHFAENHRSRHALEKLGFVDAGPKSSFCRSDGRTDIPGRHMRLSRARWQARRRLQITTPRLEIRELRDSDAADFAALCGHPDVAPMLFAMTSPWPEPKALAMIRASRYRSRIPFRAAITHEGRLVGTCGLGGFSARAASSLMYAIAPSESGKGFATEAMDALLDHIDTRLAPPLIEADHFADNPASGQVLRKLGFRKTGEGQGTSAARTGAHKVITYERRVLKTARLTLRPWRASDAAAFCEIASHWQVVRQLGASWPWPPDPKATARRATPFEGCGDGWSVVEAGRMIGSISITTTEGEAPQIGYMLTPSAQGRGLMHEAASAAITHAFAQASWPLIHATTWADNAPSQALLRKLGFTPQGTGRSFSPSRGAETEEDHFHLAREDWPTPSSL